MMAIFMTLCFNVTRYKHAGQKIVAGDCLDNCHFSHYQPPKNSLIFLILYQGNHPVAEACQSSLCLQECYAYHKCKSGYLCTCFFDEFGSRDNGSSCGEEIIVNEHLRGWLKGIGMHFNGGLSIFELVRFADGLIRKFTLFANRNKRNTQTLRQH